MAGRHYDLNTDNLFEDIDDATFLKNSTSSRGGLPTSSSSTNPFAQDLDRERQIYEQKRREIEERTIISTNRSLGLLRETEQVGTATAEELSRQREQLEKTSVQLDDINRSLRDSQKHITGLKSLWGGLRNYLSGQRPEMQIRNLQSPTGSKSMYADETSIKSPQSKISRSPDELYDTHPISRFRDEDSNHLHSQSQQFKTASFSEQLDRNLDEMAGSLSRLKDLAIDLGTEVESSNELIGVIQYKADTADINIQKQNKDMNRLLNKK